MKPDLSIIIPTRGPVKALDRTITSLLSGQKSENFELIVINDGGGQSISHYLAHLKNEGFGDIREIVNSESQGSYSARNKGIRAANSDWLLFADDDLSILGNWWEKAAPFFPDFDFICCNITMERLPRESLGEKYSRVQGFNAREKWHKLKFGLTTFLFIHARVFDEIGLFDEKIYAGSDYIFSLKVKNAGFRQKFLKDLEIKHRPKNWKAQFLMFCRMHKGKIDQAKHYPEWFDPNPLQLVDLLRTLKYMLQALIDYKHTNFYQSGEVNWLQHQIGQICYYSLYLAAQTLVLLFPKKRFNW